MLAFESWSRAIFFFFNDTATTEIYTLSLHDALPIAVLMDQYVGKPLSKRIYPEWRGGYYYAAKPKGKGKVAPPSDAPLGLLYVSRWSSADAAAEFAGIYAESLKQRY